MNFERIGWTLLDTYMVTATRRFHSIIYFPETSLCRIVVSVRDNQTTTLREIFP